MKTFIRFGSSIFPGIFADIALKRLSNPQIRKLRPHEEEVIATAQPEDYSFRDFTIKTYTWKQSDNSVLLIHGWEGQAGNFSALIERLIEAKFTVYAFDGPGHGHSSKGETSLFEFPDLVAELIQKFKPVNLVSHSFGGVATTYALHLNPEIKIHKYLLFTTPNKFEDRIKEVANEVGISTKAIELLTEKLEIKTGLKVLELKVEDWVQKIAVAEALIIHDKNDKVIPISYSRKVNERWKQSELKEIEGTGHFRILKSAEVLDTAIEFLN